MSSLIAELFFEFRAQNMFHFQFNATEKMFSFRMGLFSKCVSLIPIYMFWFISIASSLQKSPCVVWVELCTRPNILGVLFLKSNLSIAEDTLYVSRRPPFCPYIIEEPIGLWQNIYDAGQGTVFGLAPANLSLSARNATEILQSLPASVLSGKYCPIYFSSMAESEKIRKVLFIQPIC